MPARLASSSIRMLSDAVVSMFDAFVAQTRLCVFMLVICYAMISQLRTSVRCQRRTSVRCRGLGLSQSASDFGPMEGARPQYVLDMLLYGMWYFGGAH